MKLHSILNIKSEKDLLSELKKYKAFNEKEYYIENSSGKLQEIFGRILLDAFEGYEVLVDVEGERIGYDGIFIKDKKIFIYESKKWYDSSVNDMIRGAAETINAMNSKRWSQLRDAKKGLKAKYNNLQSELFDTDMNLIESEIDFLESNIDKIHRNSDYEIEKLDELIRHLKKPDKVYIDDDRHILIIGNLAKTPITRSTQKSLEKHQQKKERIIWVKYEEKFE